MALRYARSNYRNPSAMDTKCRHLTALSDILDGTSNVVGGWVGAWRPVGAASIYGSWIAFVSRNSSSPARPSSRPLPEVLYPPNGANGLNLPPLTIT